MCVLAETLVVSMCSAIVAGCMRSGVIALEVVPAVTRRHPDPDHTVAATNELVQKLNDAVAPPHVRCT
jgi:hypothetical protein